MKKLRTFAVGVGMTIAAIASAQAATIIDTLSNKDTTGGSVLTQSQVGSSRLASLIKVAQPWTLGKIEWVGNTQKTSPAFVLCLYSDAGAGPGKLVSERFLLARTTKKVVTGPNSSESYYAASVHLEGQLKAGNYWASIMGFNGAFVALDNPSGFEGQGGALLLQGASQWTPPNDGVTFYNGRGAALRLTSVPGFGGGTLPTPPANGFCSPTATDPN